MKKKADYEVQLMALEKEFKRVGYTDKVIEEIKHIDGATEVEEWKKDKYQGGNLSFFMLFSYICKWTLNNNF